MKSSAKIKKSKGVRLNWVPFEEARKEKIDFSNISGKILSKEDLEKRKGVSKSIRLLIP